MKPIKIAIIVSTFPSVSETFVLRQIVGLIQRGHDVRIFARNKDPHASIHPEYKLFHLNKQTFYFPESPSNKTLLRGKAVWLTLKNLIRSPGQTWNIVSKLIKSRKQFSYPLLFYALTVLSWTPDVIHCHFGHNAIPWAKLKTMGLLFPLVTTLHGHDVSSYPKMHGADIYQELFQTGDCFTFNSEGTKKRILDLGAPSEKLVKLPMGAAVTQIPFYEKTLAIGQPIRILSVGRLVDMKGQKFAIEAVAQVMSHYPDLEYNIVGKGPLGPSLETQIQQTGFADRIRLLGAVTDQKLHELYLTSHIFLHPSVTAEDGNTEGQGLVLVEAQAYGLVIIATQHGAFPETVLDGQSGFLVPEKNVSALQSCLLEVLSKSNRWPAMSQCGRMHAIRHYDIEMLNDQLETILQQTSQKEMYS